MYALCIPCVYKLATDVQLEIPTVLHHMIMSVERQRVPDILRREMLKRRDNPMVRKGMLSRLRNLIMEQVMVNISNHLIRRQ